MSYKQAMEIRRRAADRERKRLAKEKSKTMKGYARSSMPAIKDGTVKKK